MSRYPSSAHKPPASGGGLSSVRENLNLLIERHPKPEVLQVVELIDALMRKDERRTREKAKKLTNGVDHAFDECQALEPNIKLTRPLHMAAETGNCLSCLMLIDEFSCNTNAEEVDGTTPLISAVRGVESADVVAMLIANNADPDKADNLGFAPLHIAAKKGNLNIAQQLLGTNAKVDPKTEDGEAPLHFAAREGHAEVVALLLEFGANANSISHKLHTPILDSVWGSSLECLKFLVEAGADVNVIGSGVTPLMVAAFEGLEDCLLFLLENGADANIADQYNDLAIDFAASKGHQRCVEILLPRTKFWRRSVGSKTIEQAINDFQQDGRKASEEGDNYFWAREYDKALASYSLAIMLGYDDIDLLAKSSICHLVLHGEEQFVEKAVAYMNLKHPDMPTPIMESAAKKLILNYAIKWMQLYIPMTAYRTHVHTHHAFQRPCLFPCVNATRVRFHSTRRDLLFRKLPSAVRDEIKKLKRQEAQDHHRARKSLSRICKDMFKMP